MYIYMYMDTLARLDDGLDGLKRGVQLLTHSFLRDFGNVGLTVRAS